MKRLEEAGYEAYLVGGCVRDLLLGRVPHDFDITTDALPDEVEALFDGVERGDARWHTVPIGKEHGTIGVIASSQIFEVTTYRIDGTYSDNRHPDQVTFTRRLEDDLQRRDFTVNALAMDREGAVADFVGGRADLASEVLRAVGSPAERFDEDALRILRGVRFAAQLSGTDGAPSAAAPSDCPSAEAPSDCLSAAAPSDCPSAAAPSDCPSAAAPSDCPSVAKPFHFRIEPATAAAIHERKHLLHNIAAERIRAELDKILMAPGAVTVLREYRDVFAEFIPELAQGFDFDQRNPYHCYDVYEHTLHAVEAVPRVILPSQPAAAANNNTITVAGRSATAQPLVVASNDVAAADNDITTSTERVPASDNDRAYLTVRLAALLHDVGKPACFIVKRDRGHFYGHERVSADMAAEILRRLRYDNQTRSDVVALIRAHGTVFQLDERYVRHKLNQFGEERLRMLIALERADVSAQAEEIRAERIEAIDRFAGIVDKVLAEAQCFSLRDLAVDGRDLIALGVPAGPAVGDILSVLLENVIDGKIENDRSALLAFATQLLNEK
ncbi:MAG: HD domain-containing protein [Mogibacterium sp.]|nr:HD domain-containing protein [Mogibacterium sp.]